MKTIVAWILLLASSQLLAQDELREKIETMVKDYSCTLGVSIYSIQRGDTVSINGQQHFPMQSVFKFPIALALLSEIEQGRFSLKDKIRLQKKDLDFNTYSPIRDKYPEGVTLTLKEILRSTVSESDNVGCDILLKILGGPAAVQHYLDELGIKGISIVANEWEMHQSWDVQFKNWATPTAMTELLKKFYRRQGISKKHFELLWDMMVKSPTGPRRLKGGLPNEIEIAHKTGTSGSRDGVMAAISDVGIVVLPNKKVYFISVFVGDSRENLHNAEKIIAGISRITWEYFKDL